jgi:hypothetical protein
MATKTQTRAIMRKAVNFFDQSVKSKKAEVKQQQEKLTALQAARLSMTLLIAALIEKLGDIDLDGWIAPVGYDVNQRMLVCLHVTADGFKNPNVVRTLEFLTKEFPEVTSKDSAHFLSRCYKFSKEGVTVDFTVYVDNESPTCRREEIGEETVTVKKYRIVCD